MAMKPGVRCWNKRKATGAVKYREEEGGNVGRWPARQRTPSEGKFVLVDFLTAMENVDIWSCTAE